MDMDYLDGDGLDGYNEFAEFAAGSDEVKRAPLRFSACMAKLTGSAVAVECAG